MRRPLVSVVLPVFEAAGLLAEALGSVLDQCYRPLEVVVVDDASTDGGRLVAEQLAREHPELRVLAHAANSGAAAARNTGLAAARGRYVTFLDADDLMLPGRVGFQQEYLARHPDVDVVVGTERLAVLPGVEAPPILHRRPADRPRFYQMSMMARSDVFERVGPFDQSFAPAEDTEWMYRARAGGVRTALVDRELVVRRIHGGNSVFRTEAHRRASERALLRTARARLRAQGGDA